MLKDKINKVDILIVVLMGLVIAIGLTPQV